MIAAEMVLIDKTKMPQTHDDLKRWVIRKSKKKIIYCIQMYQNVRT